MATLFQQLQFFTSSGAPNAGGKVYWEEAGTSIAKQTWKDAAETQPHTAIITLDSAGRPPSGAIFIRGSYKLTVKNALGTETYESIDYINEYNQYDFTGLTASIADLNSTTTTALTKNSTYTLVLGDRGKTILGDASSASFNINLLPAATALNTYEITIKKSDVSTNTITILPNGSEKIDTDIEFILYDFNDFVKLHGDGSNWKVIASQIRGTVVTQTTNKTLTLEDNQKMFNCDTSGGSFNITLPDCRVVGRGYRVIFKKIDSSTNQVTLLTTASQYIDGSSNYSLHAYNQSIELKTNGLNWFIVAESRSSTDARTGDVKATYNNVQPGWVLMNDGSIGNASSLATTRANADTQDLFVLLWNTIPDVWCPVSGGRGASALVDFNGNKRLTLAKGLGRVLSNRGSADPDEDLQIGCPYGRYKIQLGSGNLAPHAHDTKVKVNSGTFQAGPICLGESQNLADDTLTSELSGSSVPISIMQPTTALYFFIKL